MVQKPKKIKRFNASKTPLPPMNAEDISSDLDTAFENILTEAESISSHKESGFHPDDRTLDTDLDSAFHQLKELDEHELEELEQRKDEAEEHISVSDTYVTQELRTLFEDILLEYIPNIRSCVNKIFRGDNSKSTVDTFLGVITPLKEAAETLNLHDILRLLKRFERDANYIRGKRMSLSYKYIRPFSDTYEQLILCLSPAMQQKYFSDTRFHTTQNPLFDKLQGIRGIGHRRLHRIFKAGLMDIEPLERATPEEIHSVTGIGLKLAKKVKRVARIHRRQVQQETVGRVVQNALNLKADLQEALDTDNAKLLAATQSAVDELRNWLDNNSYRVHEKVEAVRRSRGDDHAAEHNAD